MYVLDPFKPLEAKALSGKVVLVIGATGGLGTAAALECARAGASLILLGRKVPILQRLYDAIEKEGGPQPAIYPLNLEGATPADFEQMAEAIRESFGRLDGVIFATAHFKGLTPLELIEPEEWIRGMHVNFGAQQLVVQACLPLLRETQRASVVFCINDQADEALPNWGAYGVSQSALRSYVRVLASELEHAGVRVRAVFPGAMRTSLRGTAYFSENPEQIPHPNRFAPALAWLIGNPHALVDHVLIDIRHLGSAPQ